MNLQFDSNNDGNSLSALEFAPKYSRQKNFTQTKLDDNNFTSRVWWALIEEITVRVEVMACGKEMACCVIGYHVYKDNWAAAIGEVLVCSREPTNAEKFRHKIYSRKIFAYVFLVRKYFHNEIKANYSNR